MKTHLIPIVLLGAVSLQAQWVAVNALDSEADLPRNLAKEGAPDPAVIAGKSFWWTGLSGGQTEQIESTHAIVPDPSGLKNPDGSPVMVYQVNVSPAFGNVHQVAFNFPEVAPIDRKWTFYFRWMYATGSGAAQMGLDTTIPPAAKGGFISRIEDWPASPLCGNSGIRFHPWPNKNEPPNMGWNQAGSWTRGANNGEMSRWLFDNWYEFWVVVDPLAGTGDLYFRGGHMPEQHHLFKDALFTDLFKADGFHYYQIAAYSAYSANNVMGYAPMYWDAIHVDFSGVNLTVPDGVDILASGEEEHWLGYPVLPNGFADTAPWMGWVYVDHAPWVWNLNLGNWLFVNDDSGWVYIPK